MELKKKGVTVNNKFKLLFITLLLSATNLKSSQLIDAINLRLNLKATIGEKCLILTQNKDFKECDLLDIIIIDLGEGSFIRKTVNSKVNLQSFNIANLLGCQVVKEIYLSYDGRLHSKFGNNKSVRLVNTVEYFDLIYKISLDIKNSVIINNNPCIIELLDDIDIKNEEKNKFLGLTITGEENTEFYTIKNFFPTSIGSELSLLVDDKIYGVKSANTNYLLDNLFNYDFDSNFDHITFDIERNQKRIEITIPKPSYMETKLCAPSTQ